MRVAWVLNLDADHELRRPLGYGPTAAVSARMRELAPRVIGLVRAGDVVIAPGDPPPAAPEAYVGRAWCPTPRALRILGGAGIAAPPSPPLAVLQRVNHRRFASDLGQTLDDAQLVADEGELPGVVARGARWLLKRPYSFAGNGRRIVSGALSDADAAWVRASLSGGETLQVEPWLEIAGEYALHGHVSASREVTVGEICIQAVDAFGAWLGSERAPAGVLSPAEAELLHAEVDRVAHGLIVAGYFGPFGVDAYHYRDGGARRFNPRSEINARYTMGWAVGMGERRPDVS